MKKFNANPFNPNAKKSQTIQTYNVAFLLLNPNPHCFKVIIKALAIG
jgi:hypothetical protein